MKKFFKSIWNFFFKKKESFLIKKNIEGILKKEINDIFKSVDQEAKQKSQTQLFRKQQFINKIYNIGKHRYRIKQKIGFTESEKLRYQITQL